MDFIIRILKSFSQKERLVFTISFAVFVISSVFWTVGIFYKKTVLAAVSGGEYVEGVMGQPSFINPILSAPNSPDADMEELLFAKLVDMSDDIKTSADSSVWDVRLKENIFWDDKQPITSQDIDFTIKRIQNSDAQSPLSPMWQGVQIEVVSKLEIKLYLPQPYAFFGDTLKNLRVVPEHLFSGVAAANLKISDYNLEPTGDGPFKFNSFKKEKSGFISEYKFVRNDSYFGKKPYIESVVFKFYKTEDDLVRAFNAGEISGFGGISAESLKKVLIGDKVFDLSMPRYYALFFNAYAQKNLADANVRLALTYATNKTGMIENIFKGEAVPVDGPVILGMDGYSQGAAEEFSLDKAANTLDAAGWKPGSDGIREKTVAKQTQRLEFNLDVPNTSFLVETANALAADWLKIGVRLNVSVRSADNMEEIIKTRNYQMIIFGNSFNSFDAPDMSSFWHSSQKFYPGMNLSLYENKNVDNDIEIIRQTTSISKRRQALADLQSRISNDMPAVFLFSPNYLYVGRPYLGGLENGAVVDSASARFDNISDWYIKTARIFK